MNIDKLPNPTVQAAIDTLQRPAGRFPHAPISGYI
jgi:hypothetical protein